MSTTRQGAINTAAKEKLATDETLVGLAAGAIWRQHMNKLEPDEQISWEQAAPLGRGITLAYARAALSAIDAYRS